MSKIFAEGISVFKPREGAPSFVKGAISIRANDLITWLDANRQYESNGYIRLDILESKDGQKWYTAVNDYKTDSKPDPVEVQKKTEAATAKNIEYPEEESNPNDVPF